MSIRDRLAKLEKMRRPGKPAHAILTNGERIRRIQAIWNIPEFAETVAKIKAILERGK